MRFDGDQARNEEAGCHHLFHCGAGNGSFGVGHDGTFRLCSSLWLDEWIEYFCAVALERAKAIGEADVLA